MKIEVLPPDINVSESEFTIDGDNIRFGLSAIKNVGAAAIESVLEARRLEKFTGFTDFLTKVDLRKVNKKTVESLIKANAFSTFGNCATLLTTYPETVSDISRDKESHEKGQFGLFAGHVEKKKAIDSFKVLPEYAEDQLAMFEKEVIGFLITKNPLSRFASIIKAKASKQIGEITKLDTKKTLILAGVISSKKLIKTKKESKDMAFITLYDDTGSIEAVIFPKSFEKLRSILDVNQAIIAKGTIANREDSMSFLIDNAVKLG